MTAVPTLTHRTTATPFERMLLHLARDIERVATVRALRRAERPSHRTDPRESATTARADARALGSLGIMPR